MQTSRIRTGLCTPIKMSVNTEPMTILVHQELSEPMNWISTPG
jgi:hypothetical protein